MARYKSSTWKKVTRQQNIAAYYRHKSESALIPENDNVYQPKISPDAVIIIKLKGQPQMQFSSYKTPFGWSISPTLAGKKVQQVLMRA